MPAVFMFIFLFLQPSAFKEQYDQIRKEEGDTVFAQDEEDDEEADRRDDEIEVMS